MNEEAVVAVVDDEDDLREPVVDYLCAEGVPAVGAANAKELDALMAKRPVSLVVLDVNMPGEDGFSIARRLRAAGGGIGVVMLTAKRDLVDRVVGLELGADDYVTKPFEPRELLARIRAVTRRIADQTAPSPPPAQRDAPAEEDRAFWVQSGAAQVRVPFDAIEWIEAERDYAILYTAERNHMVRVTMTELERLLEPEMMRVHRSAFVRPSAIRQISRAGRQMTVVLASGAAVRVGPSYAEKVRAAHRPPAAS